MGGYIRTIYRDGRLEDTRLLHGVTEATAAQLGVVEGEEKLPDGRVQVTHRSEPK